MFPLVQRFTRLLPKGFVLAFHDIPPEKVSEFIESLRPARPIPLPELVERSKQGKSTGGLFAITVDDGVGETVRNLSHLFCARRWPATFYISTGYLDSKEGMAFQWWRSLLPFLPARKLVLKSGAVVDLSRPGSVQELSRQMERMWHSQRSEAYLPMTLELAAVVIREHALSPSFVRPPEPVSWAEVAELSRSEMIRFESHGVSHGAMSALSDEEIATEMRVSQELVSSHTGQPCRHLAYPFGSAESIGPRAELIARKFYDSAVTMTLGNIDSANPWLLPRIPLYTKNSRWFAKMKLLVKCSDFSIRPTVVNGPSRTETTAASLTEPSPHL